MFPSAADREFARAISDLGYGNPFLPERIDNERRALGAAFVGGEVLWHLGGERGRTPNVQAIEARVEALVERLAPGVAAAAARASAEDRRLWEDLATYALFARHDAAFYGLIEDRGRAATRVGFYGRFREDAQRLLGPLLPERDVPHLFACLFQVRRAFHHIFRTLVGGSLPIARLRAAVWQSIFTRDMRRYRRALFGRMGDVATLIVGPSGTGKELVARAIGLARYLPFDPAREAFAEDFAASFYALNPSALSPTLIESELFGHRRGAFTGAVADRVGWLEVCPPLGTVFLDEVGEVEPAIQVKLLRVLQERTFQRLGDTRDRRFQGKLVAATNRDLAREIAAGRFRRDFYYRLCSDVIVTPALADQLRGSPDERRTLLRFLAERVAGAGEAERLAAETDEWIGRHLGDDYPWPGNVRELEQCVRNVMIRGEYQPPRPAARGAAERLAAGIAAGSLTAEELLRAYCTLVYAQTGSYVEVGRRLGLDRRTVRDRIDPGWLAEARGEEPPPVS